MIRGYIDGLLPEKLKLGAVAKVPYISINAFSKHECSCTTDWNKCRVFFLTHCEEELIKNVLNLNFLEKLSQSPNNSCILFMHELVYNHLIYWITTTATNKTEKIEGINNKKKIFRFLQQLRRTSKIIFVQTNSRLRFVFENLTKQCDRFIVDITSLSAGHNAGSIMLLIEPRPQGEGEGDENEERILYTGNCRITLHDLRACQALYHKCGAMKFISELYIDTTFCMPHVKELPPRNMVEEYLIDFFKEEMINCSSNDIRFEIWTPFDVSSLHFLHSIHSEFNQMVHVPPNLNLLLEQLPNCNEWTTSTSGINCNFHYCCGQINNNLTCCSNGDFNSVYDVCNMCLQCDMFRTPVFPTEDETEWNDKGNCIYVKKPDIFRAIYSSHLSRYELARMINFLGVNIEKIYPIYRPKFMTLENVKDLLRKTCNVVNDQEEHKEKLFSHEYDFTGEHAPSREFYRQKPTEYCFDTEIDDIMKIEETNETFLKTNICEYHSQEEEKLSLPVTPVVSQPVVSSISVSSIPI